MSDEVLVWQRRGDGAKPSTSRAGEAARVKAELDCAGHTVGLFCLYV